MEPWKKPRGGKPTRVKYDDELSRVHWSEFERIINRWYAAQGYAVEHRGTGAKGLTDGGVDLVLRGRGERVLVQCKHARAWQVPYNAAMQLRGLIHAEEADRAILITSGEFTPEAMRKARIAGRLEMIDGKALRELLGPDIAGWRDAADGTDAPTLAPPTRVVAAPSIVPRDSVPVEVGLPPPAPPSPVASNLTARPVASGISRGIAAGCVVVCVGVLAVLVYRLGARPPEAAPETTHPPAPKPVAAMPARPAPPVSRHGNHEVPVVNAMPRTRTASTPRPKVVAPRPGEGASPPPAAVIYKSSNMSDAEFAAWKLRKAQRERGGQEPAAEVADGSTPPAIVRQPASADAPPAEAPGVPAQTMQTILRTNRR